VELQALCLGPTKPHACVSSTPTCIESLSEQFANSRVHLSIQDEATKIDLNRAPEARLAALFGSVGVEPGEAQSLAAAIADFRDADDFVRPGGAEEAEYRAAGLAWGPKNAPFQAVEEL
jgi:general secretion pathway protein K